MEHPENKILTWPTTVSKFHINVLLSSQYTAQTEGKN